MFKMKIKDGWYKNKTWNGSIDKAFEAGLKRERGNNNKANCLQIQGCLLLLNTQKNIQEVGTVLLNRIFEDFEQEHISVLMAKECLGDYYLQQQQYYQAAAHYNWVHTETGKQLSAGGTSGLVPIKLADALFHLDAATHQIQIKALLANFSIAALKTPKSKQYHAQLISKINF